MSKSAIHEFEIHLKSHLQNPNLELPRRVFANEWICDDMGAFWVLQFLDLNPNMTSQVCHVLREVSSQKAILVLEWKKSQLVSQSWIGEGNVLASPEFHEDDETYIYVTDNDSFFDLKWRPVRKLLRSQKKLSPDHKYFSGGVLPNSLFSKSDLLKFQIDSVQPNPAHNLSDLVQALRSSSQIHDSIFLDLQNFVPAKNFQKGLHHLAHHTLKKLHPEGRLFIKHFADSAFPDMLSRSAIQLECAHKNIVQMGLNDDLTANLNVCSAKRVLFTFIGV